MEYVLYELPPYAEKIIRILQSSDWLIHSFELSCEDEIYNSHTYLQNHEYNGMEYTIHLDLNIYQYVLSAVKKENKKDLHRSAIALIVFGMFTNITFDTTIAVYEKLNYKDQCSDELVDDLMLFRRIDNSNMDDLADFALGLTDAIHLQELPVSNISELKKNLTKYKRLKKWDSLYLFVLKATELYYFDKSSNDSKIQKFWEWCHSDFAYSLVATSFVIKLFGNKPIPKLMKYNPKFSSEKNKKQLTNMAWDLFLLDKFFENWVNKDSNKEFIYASNDKPFKEVLKIAISMQVNGDGRQLIKDLPETLIVIFNNITGNISSNDGRHISSVKDFKSFRDRLINKVEKKLLQKAQQGI